MVKQPLYKIADVKPVTFEKHLVSDDGEKVIFEIRDKSGNIGHIAVDWLRISLMIQVILRGAEQAAEIRRSLGKQNDFDAGPGLQAQLVSRFQVSEYPDNHLKVLSLHSPVGFRCDFAIPTNTVDQCGRALPRAIAEELLSNSLEHRQKPN